MRIRFPGEIGARLVVGQVVGDEIVHPHDRRERVADFVRDATAGRGRADIAIRSLPASCSRVSVRCFVVRVDLLDLVVAGRFFLGKEARRHQRRHARAEVDDLARTGRGELEVARAARDAIRRAGELFDRSASARVSVMYKQEHEGEHM